MDVTNIAQDVVESLYMGYVESLMDTEQERVVRLMSGMVEDKLEAGVLGCSDLAAYEEAARSAGFYAGFAACLSMLSAEGR